jgi:hypothetical protein
MAWRDKRLARGVKRPALGRRILRARPIGRAAQRPLEKAFMMDSLIGRLRVWHFGYICRRHPERIGLEVRRMLADLPEATRWAHLRDLALSETSGRLPRALGAVAASRWKITNHAEVARLFESLTEDQQERIYSAVDFILPRSRG